jgi:hypothetical protein
MRISNYIDYVKSCEEELAKAFKAASKHHVAEPDIHEMCKLFASWSLDHAENLNTMLDRYGAEEESEPYRVDHSLLSLRTDGLDLLRDLHDLWLMTNEVKLCWIILQQSAKALNDEKLKLACVQFGSQTTKQAEWLMTKIKHAAPQVLTVPV